LHRHGISQYRLENIDDFALAILFGILGAVVGWIFISIFVALIACLLKFQDQFIYGQR
jgi:hypothetical protein